MSKVGSKRLPGGKKQTSAAQSARADNRKRAEKRRRGKRNAHHILVMLFLLSAGVILSLTFFFKLEAVNVTGSVRYDPLEIVTATGIKVGDNLLRIPTRDIEKALLEAYPWIETVKLRRTLPPAIEVEITQSKPCGAIANGEEHILITREGKVLDRGLLLLTNDIILIKGVDAGNRNPGEYLGRWTIEYSSSQDETPAEKAAREKRNASNKIRAEEETDALVMLGYLFDAMDATGFTSVTNVDLTDRLNMKIVYENRLTLELGSEADLEDKLLFVDLVLKWLHPNAHGTIDVTDVRNDMLLYSPAEGYRDDGTPLDEPVSDDKSPDSTDIVPLVPSTIVSP